MSTAQPMNTGQAAVDPWALQVAHLLWLARQGRRLPAFESTLQPLISGQVKLCIASHREGFGHTSFSASALAKECSLSISPWCQHAADIWVPSAKLFPTLFPPWKSIQRGPVMLPTAREASSPSQLPKNLVAFDPKQFLNHTTANRKCSRTCSALLYATMSRLKESAKGPR